MEKFSIICRSTNFRFVDLFVGRCVEGFQTLTGKPCEVSQIENVNLLKLISSFLQVFLLHSTDRKNQPNLNDIWTKIIQSRAKG